MNAISINPGAYAADSGDHGQDQINVVVKWVSK